MVNFKEDEQLKMLNHSCAHLMAQAIKHLYPQAKFWVGPVVAEGFYYDVDLGDDVIRDEDIAAIEKEMKKVAKSGKKIVRHEISKEEALEMFKDDEYKIDLINGLEDGNISCYTQGDFTDLCRGPHVDNVKLCRHFKLLRHSGAYWKGDSKNKVLQRIYGVCFPTAEELEAHLQLLEEAKERDHRKIGKDMELFMVDDLVGRGLPMFLPKGYTIWQELENYIKEKERKLGYQHVMTPCVGTVNLYKTSGHWDHYKENMFPAMEVDDEAFVLRPMNCPHHMMIYANKRHSYRDLPIRIGEIAHEHGILFHTDAVQAFGQLPINVDECHIDMLSASGHKFNGPKGIGIMYIRTGVKIRSFIHGGAQERKRRAGTENVHGIVGIGTAAKRAAANMEERTAKEREVRDYLIDRVLNEIPYCRLNGHRTDRLPNTANFSFQFVEGESLLIKLDMKGICGSSGSACTSGSLDPSHVLLAIGLPHEIAHGSLRLTLNEEIEKEDIDYVVDNLKEIVAHLREMSPLYEDFIKKQKKQGEK